MNLITVVIPALNAEAYLKDAIDSVLEQGRPGLKILVVDNGSTDHTADITRAYGDPVRLLHCPIPGMYAALNVGIHQVQAEWLAFLDADDLWVPERLRRQFEVLQANPDWDAVFGQVLNFSGDIPIVENRHDGQPAPLLGSLLLKMSAFLKVGYFDERYTLGSNMDWYMRAQDAGLRMEFLQETVLLRRIHENNLGKREKQKQTDYAAILRAALHRRQLKGTGRS